MTIQNVKFFLTDFHKGFVNIMFHILGIGMLVFGLLYHNLVFAILGLFVIDEIGHIYNYYTFHHKNPKYNPWKILLHQTIYIVPLGLIE